MLGKFADFTVSVKVFVPKLVGEIANASLNEIVLKSADKLMNAAAGVKVAVIGQTIKGLAISTSVLIVTV